MILFCFRSASECALTAERTPHHPPSDPSGSLAKSTTVCEALRAQTDTLQRSVAAQQEQLRALEAEVLGKRL